MPTTVISGVQNTFGTGAHTVSETTDPAYTAVISGDCAANGSITLAANDVKACTITNTFKRDTGDGDREQCRRSSRRPGQVQSAD